ncbi:hypothetical protein G6O67_008112 [Ophiocordyceps sinensis]|uniref:Uncharacterized protein n=1 Tax=Ophiocordyceps sinensis TaxID=72228 RepID=A0A8H4LSV6_9HYPO|nr:hypothetical protein G6O67_008112 [Ophiocordyceps sinensis]
MTTHFYHVSDEQLLTGPLAEWLPSAQALNGPENDWIIRQVSLASCRHASSMMAKCPVETHKDSFEFARCLLLASRCLYTL